MKTRKSVTLSLFSLLVLQANAPREGFTDRRVDKDKGLLVCAETGESNSKEDRSYTKKQILFSQRQKMSRLRRIQIRLSMCACVCLMCMYRMCVNAPCSALASRVWDEDPPLG